MILSKTMQEVINMMELHEGKLVRWNGGFWTFEGTKSEYDVQLKKWPDFYKDADPKKAPVFYGNMLLAKGTPEWHCNVRTLRALEKRNLVILDELNKICKLKEKEKAQ